MDITTRISEIIEPSIVDMGYTLVLVKLSEGGRKTLTVMAERSDGRQMSFDDCTEISHMVGALLEVEDPISGAYNLEVSSPGIDRPLTKEADYKKFAGHDIKLETRLPMDGRKRFKGKLEGMEGNAVCLVVDGQPVQITYDNIRSAKLLITDTLVAGHMKKQNVTQD